MVNYITVCRNDFDSKEEWEQAVARAIKVLIENKYIVRMELQDFGTVMIEFDYQEHLIAEHRCVWLTDTELNTVVYDDEKAGKIDE